jgi:hypothetical protein
MTPKRKNSRSLSRKRSNAGSFISHPDNDYQTIPNAKMGDNYSDRKSSTKGGAAGGPNDTSQSEMEVPEEELYKEIKV